MSFENYEPDSFGDLLKSKNANETDIVDADSGDDSGAEERDMNEDEQKEVVKEGYLRKEGLKVKSWKRRWFELRGKTLFYYKKQGGKKKGSFVIAGVTMSEDRKKGRENTFKMEAKGRTWFLQALNRSEMFAWIDALSEYGGAVENPPEVTDQDLEKYRNTINLKLLFSDDSDADLSNTDNEKSRKNRVKQREKDSQRFSDSELQTEDESVYLPSDVKIEESDSDNSDEELWKILRERQVDVTPRKPSQRHGIKRKVRNVSESEESSEPNVDDLFTYFQQKSERKIAEDPSLSKQKEIKVLKANLAMETPRYDDYLQEAFSGINVVNKNKDEVNYADVDPDEIKDEVRRKRIDDKTEYDTPTDSDGSASSNKPLNEEFGDMVVMDDPEFDVATRGKWTGSKFRRFLDMFRLYPYSLVTYAVTTVLIAIVCLIYYFADILPRHLFLRKNSPTDFQAVFLSENFLLLFRGVFSQQNRGVLSIVTSLEIAISESGAYLYEYLLKGGPKTLFLKGYVGKVLQLGVYSSVIYGTISCILCFAFIDLFTKGIGFKKPVIARNYMFMRAPFLALYFMWSTFQSVMFGTLKMWEWCLWNIFIYTIFFSLILIGMKWLNGWITMGLAFDITIVFSVLGALLLFSLPTFMKRHKTYDLKQSFGTLARYSKLSLFVFVINIFPVIITFVYNTVQSNRSADNFLALSAVNMPIDIFLQFGMLFNGISMVIGVRCVKRAKYKDFIWVIVRSLVNIVVIISITLGAFFALNLRDTSVKEILGLTNPDPDDFKRIKEITDPMWKIGLFTVPLILLENLYQTFLYCFESYYTLLSVAISTNLLIMLPGMLLVLFKFDSLVGIYYVQMLQQMISLLIFAAKVHIWELPQLKKTEMRRRMEKIDRKALESDSDL